MMFECDNESIDDPEAEGTLATKGTKYTKEINNQEADDLLEFNTRRGMYAEIRCPTPTSIVIRQVLLAGLQLRGANHPSLPRFLPLSCISSVSW